MTENCECVSDLLDRLVKLRRNEIAIDSNNFTVLTPTDRHVYPKLFAEYFLCGAHCTVPHCSAQSDDMLWYVRMQSSIYSNILNSGGTVKPAPIEVYRRHSKKQPCPGDQAIDWEETVYLNIILHHIEFILTCAVCTKTSPQNLQILRKISQKVHASPSRRRMDNKGESEEIAYPNIFFPIDGFEDIFSTMVVRDGECVCVELIARDQSLMRESTVFLGSIRYEVLKQVYDSRASSTSTWSGWASKMLPTSGLNRRLEFVRMKGPHGKGYAEMAVSRVEGQGYETPSAEELPFEAFEVDAVESYRRRRMSDTNLAAKYYFQPRSPVKKSRSEADYVQQYPEVEASSIDDELDESVFSRLWGMRGFGQAWHWLREKRRSTCTPLNSYLTYVSLPWQSIIEDKPLDLQAAAITSELSSYGLHTSRLSGERRAEFNGKFYGGCESRVRVFQKDHLLEKQRRPVLTFDVEHPRPI